MCNVCACLSVCSLLLLVNCIEVHEPTKYPVTPSRRALIQPEIHHARTKRQLSTTRQESGSHHDELLVTITVEGEPYTMDLKLNHGLLPEGHILSYQEGEETVLHKPNKEEMDFCQYTGHIRGKPNSWVALSTCHGLRGAINDGTKIRYIEPSEEKDLQSPHYVYEEADLETQRRCGNDDLYPQKSNYKDFLQVAKKPRQENDTRKTRYKREPSFQIRGPFNATERSRYVELVLVTDYALYLGVNRDLKRLYHQLQETTNILHAIYAPLNIFIALTGVEVWTTGDRIALTRNSSTTLDNFLQYRREVLLKSIAHHDHAQLITATKFDKGVVGEAYVSKMGSYDRSGAVIYRPAYRVSAATIASTAATMAHEMGHNFGMSHDTKDSGCRDEYCVMHSSAVSPIPVHFSDKNLKELMLELYKGIDYALRNKPTSLFGAPSCGNGFVDPGEECDCGVTVQGIVTNGCHRCCNPNTCRLRSNSTCATGACCNFETCQIKPVATLCRAADRECDLPEYCTGDSEYCPEDVFKMDTTPCSEKAYCVQGKCRSRDTQCHLLWGNPAKSGKQDCYDKNMMGDAISNCGFDVLTNRSQRCEQKHVSCGRLYCHHYSPRLEFGNFNYRRTYYSPNYTNGISMCDAIRIDSVSSEDLGMVPDGAECGAGQMCLQQRCVAVDDARAHIVEHHSKGCRANCSGHGICNSKGQCHCDDGFSPPLCDLPGVGGSDESGPAGDPNVQETFKLVMFIIFLGLVPLTVLILLLIYFIKRKSLLCFGRNSKFHRSISSTTSVKKRIHSLFNNKDGNIKSKNTSTDFNSNARSDPVKNIAKHDIKIIRDIQAEAALQSKFDINSYVNYRNGTQESVMKMTKEDIKVIMSGTVEDLPKLLSNGDVNVNNDHLGVHKVIENIMVGVKVEHTSQLKYVNNIKSTHNTHAVPTKHDTENADNIVSNTSVIKHKAVVTDNMKIDLKLKPTDKVKPVPHSKPINYNKGINFKSKTDRNLNEVSSINIISNHAIAKRPVEKNIVNTAPDIPKVETNANDVKFKPNQKVIDKPITHQKSTKLNQTFIKGTKPTKVISENTLESWPKLKPVKNSPFIKKNLESSSETIPKEKPNGLSKGVLKLKL